MPSVLLAVTSHTTTAVHTCQFPVTHVCSLQSSQLSPRAGSILRLLSVRKLARHRHPSQGVMKVSPHRFPHCGWPLQGCLSPGFPVAWSAVATQRYANLLSSLQLSVPTNSQIELCRRFPNLLRRNRTGLQASLHWQSPETVRCLHTRWIDVASPSGRFSTPEYSSALSLAFSDTNKSTKTKAQSRVFLKSGLLPLPSVLTLPLKGTESGIARGVRLKTATRRCPRSTIVQGNGTPWSSTIEQPNQRVLYDAGLHCCPVSTERTLDLNSRIPRLEFRRVKI